MGLFSTIYIPETVVPPRAETERTLLPTAQKAKFCSKCGSPLVPTKNFCVECGQSTVQKHRILLTNKKIFGKQIAQMTSQWLAENPYLYDVRLNADLTFMDNDFDRVNQVFANTVSAEYSIADKPINVQYGVEYLYEYKVSVGFKQYSVNYPYLIDEWQKKNPGLKPVQHFGGRTYNTSNGTYQYYALVVYQKPMG